MLGFGKRRRLRAQAATALGRFQSADAATALGLLRELEEIESSGDLPLDEVDDYYRHAYVTYVDAAVRDDLIGSEEVHALAAINRHLGPVDPDPSIVLASNRLSVASINTWGVRATSSDLIIDDGETVVWEAFARLFKPRRGFRGHSPGVSIPLGSGVRLRWSYFEGEATSSQSFSEADNGPLSVTTRRLVFRGSLSTLHTNLDDIIGLDAFSDGLRVHSSRRQRVDLFATAQAPVAAANIYWLLDHPDAAPRPLGADTQA
jgi:hypothetical protein